MKQIYHTHGITFVTILLFSSVLNNKTLAQVIPDNTLGSENSQVNPVDEMRDLIEGGAVRGKNLFHSFEEFNVKEGANVNFANPESVVNIFSRVTGSNSSEIFGSLGVKGAANLFFLNPNGIVFGKNSAVNINGSLLFTTANSIDFDNGDSFSSSDLNVPLITISFPIGLSFEDVASDQGIINVNGIGHSINGLGGNSIIRENNTVANLESSPPKTLALIGNKINFDGGILVSPSGNLELGSVREGTVAIKNFNPGEGLFNLDYSEIELFGDITFATRSLLDVSSPINDSSLGSGSVTLQGRNIFLKDGSFILSQNFGKSNSGLINIFASNSFQINGTDPIARVLSGMRTEALSIGNGGDIKISTPQFSIVDGGSIQAYSYSSFPNTASGNIDINTLNLQVLGASPRSAFGSSNITTFTFNVSQAGNISIDSDKINLEEGGLIGSSGILGAVGEININAAEYLRINGFQPESLLSSNIVSINTLSPIPGRINITSPNIFIEDGASISTSTFAGGSAGNIIIDTNNLEITGRKEPASALAEKVPSNISSSTAILDAEIIKLFPDTFDISNFTNLPLQGNSGSIEINADSIKIENTGQITVINQGTGDAGNLKINADFISLANAGGIFASTASRQGGNITLNSENLDLLNQSQITASAGGNGNGGNISINSDTILGIENSDISANAIGGDGGNITINSDFILGFEERVRLTRFSDITASSEFGIDGTVIVNSPNSNLKEQVFASFKNYAPPENRELLEKKCLNPANPKGKIINIGRAGVPANPDNFFDDDEIIAIEGIGSNEPYESTEQPQIWVEGDPIIQPNAVKVGADGETYLVSETRLEDAEAGICIRKAKE